MKAFVLTGGGSLGAVHAGMLRALYEQEIRPDLIVGASVGAVNGSFIASRPQTLATADALGDVWRGLARSDIFPRDFVTGLLGFTGRHAHLVPNRGLRRLLTTNTQFENLEDSPIPFHVVATDAATGQDLALSSGNTVRAVLATVGQEGRASAGGPPDSPGQSPNTRPPAHRSLLSPQERAHRLTMPHKQGEEMVEADRRLSMWPNRSPSACSCVRKHQTRWREFRGGV